jgi:hypothetical protein
MLTAPGLKPPNLSQCHIILFLLQRNINDPPTSFLSDQGVAHNKTALAQPRRFHPSGPGQRRFYLLNYIMKSP